MPGNNSPREAVITAIVTSADHPTGLGAARGLRSAGAKVVGFTHRPDAWPCRSWAWDAIEVFSSAATSTSVAQVLEFARNINGPVFLLPSEDDLVAEFSKVKDQFPDNLQFCCPSYDVVQTLLEKTRFAIWAEAQGFPVPQTILIHSHNQLLDQLEHFKYPAILKPLVRTPEWQAASPVQKAIRLESPDDISNIPFDLFKAAPSYILSEWIEGDDSDVYFCLVFLDSDSRVKASFTGRKLLQFPRLTGSTAICVDANLPQLEKLTADLFRSVGCQGLASLEIKRSAENGQLLITEPTVVRPNLQSYSAVAAGVNLYGIAMRHAWGRDYNDLILPRKRCIWIEERALFEVFTSRSEFPIQIRMILRESIKARRIAAAYFSLKDPAPFFAMSGSWIRNGLRRIWHRGT